MSERDGNWMDEMGACKVCDGEIPHGHGPHCDILKLEDRIRQLERATKEMAETLIHQASDRSEFGVRCFYRGAAFVEQSLSYAVGGTAIQDEAQRLLTEFKSASDAASRPTR